MLRQTGDRPYQLTESTMSIDLMKTLRFTEFGPPSVLRIEEVLIPESGEGGSTCSRGSCGHQSQRHRQRCGTFQENNPATNSRRDFAGIVAKGTHREGNEIRGSYPALGIAPDGSHAEYVVVPAETISRPSRSR